MSKKHKHNKDTNTHNDNGIVLHISKDAIVNKSEEELADVFSGIGASLKEIVEPSDNSHNMSDCASCDLASECHNCRTEPYDSDVRQAADEEDYIDSVQYPLDPYINPLRMSMIIWLDAWLICIEAPMRQLLICFLKLIKWKWLHC